MAAAIRDQSNPPEFAFRAIHQANFDHINDAFIKKAVNLVYFDDRFAQASGYALSQQITSTCMNPHSDWKPIQ